MRGVECGSRAATGGAGEGRCVGDGRLSMGDKATHFSHGGVAMIDPDQPG